MKCPRGTPSQVRANLARIQNLSPCLDESLSWVLDPNKGHVLFGEEESLPGESSEELEFDSNKADKRSPPTPRDELVYFFVSCLLDILVESWEGKPCVKSVNFTVMGKGVSEVLGEADLDLVQNSGSLSESVVEDKNIRAKRHECAPFNSKLEKSSNSNDSQCMNEEDFEMSDSLEGWRTFVPDENVRLRFLNGVWYEGRTSRRMMEGEGTYFWEDGSIYQGEFVGGCVTGKGRLEFPDLSVYEGEVYKSFRHGNGLFCLSESPVMYSGQWWLGKKHGEGLIVYNDPSKALNFYKGDWRDGEKEGFGLRQYSSKTMYLGFWSNGKRHGKGIMLWSNNDIYRGEWKEGVMHGYGEYTWNGFLNESFCYPSTNTYRGFWSEGKRNGQGSFEVMNGALIETLWIDNVKEGPGTVVCSNGSVVTSERLFLKDKQASFNYQDDETGLLLRDQMTCRGRSKHRRKNEGHLLAYLRSIEKAKAISIPIYSSPHCIDLQPHTNKLLSKIRENMIRNLVKSYSNFQMIRPYDSEQSKESASDMKVSNNDLLEADSSELSQCILQEEKYLRNTITANISTLKVRQRKYKGCYTSYATLACSEPPSFECFLLKLFLWQLFVDSGTPDHNLSLVDIDNILVKEEYLVIENVHDPFERLYLWQFIHIIVIVSWYLYGRYIFDEMPLVENRKISDFINYYEEVDCKMVLKAAFDYFLERDILPGLRSRENGENKFLEHDLIPLEAMYKIYRNIGEPHSARQFMTAICVQADEEAGVKANLFEYLEKLPSHKTEGKNVITTAGKLSYLPKPEPFNHPQILQMKRKTSQTELKSRLTCFSGLKAKRVVKCLSQVCTGIVSDDFIVNMDYQLTFLEFYKVIIECAELMLKINVMNEIRDDLIEEHKKNLEEYEILWSEYEKMKDGTGMSTKRSKILREPSKKGKK